ncbi:hypothetical protein Save01_09196 [Streptomyces avermitilis]
MTTTSACPEPDACHSARIRWALLGRECNWRMKRSSWNTSSASLRTWTALAVACTRWSSVSRSRSRLWGWRVVTQAGRRHPRDCGISSSPRRTLSGSSRPTVDGTWSSSTTRTPTAQEPVTRAAEGFSMTRATSTPRSSSCHRVRRWQWTRSSACCSKPLGKRSNRAESTRGPCAEAGPGFSWGSIRRTTPPDTHISPQTQSRATCSLAARQALRQAVSPTTSGSKALRSLSTPRVPPRSSPCIWPAKRSGPVNAPWRSQAAPPSWPLPSSSPSSLASGAWPQTAGARRFRRRRTGPAGPRVWGCCWWSGSPTPAATVTVSWPSSAAAPSTRTAQATA